MKTLTLEEAMKTISSQKSVIEELNYENHQLTELLSDFNQKAEIIEKAMMKDIEIARQSNELKKKIENINEKNEELTTYLKKAKEYFEKAEEYIKEKSSSQVEVEKKKLQAAYKKSLKDAVEQFKEKSKRKFIVVTVIMVLSTVIFNALLYYIA